MFKKMFKYAYLVIGSRLHLSKEPKMNSIHHARKPPKGAQEWKVSVFGLKMHFARRKSAARFLYFITFSGKVVRHSLAYLTVHKWLVGVTSLNAYFVSQVNHLLVWQPCRSALSWSLTNTLVASHWLQCSMKFLTMSI